jgi:ELWxxDGT repeat protein
MVGSDDSHGSEFWKYDGTNTPVFVADLNLVARPVDSDSRDGCVFQNKLYFHANNATYGWELWSYDGTIHQK